MSFAPFFETPRLLSLLWALPGIVLLLVLLRFLAYRRMRRFVGVAMLPRIVPQIGFRTWLFRSGVFILSIFFAIIACAGPRFGEIRIDASSTGLDVFVLLDVSRSMLAEDVPPNRLQRAKSDLRDLLEEAVGDRVGLIVFTGTPVIRVPLTDDRGFFLETLEKLEPESVRRGGTAIGDAIRLAVRTFPKTANRDQVILLITDGEDHDSFPLEAAKEAASKEIRVFTLGTGDPQEGARIPLVDARGTKTYLQYEGKDVYSKADTKMLREIATITDGVFFPVQSSAFDLGALYRSHLADLKKGEFRRERRLQYRERFQFFLFLAVALQCVLLFERPQSRGVPSIKRVSRNSVEQQDR